MYLEASQVLQLIVALIGAMIIFVAANSAPIKISIGILLVFIPFQPVETRFGSANVVMTFVLFGALLLQGRIRYLPLLWAMLAVIFAYLLSISQINRALYVEHGLQLMFLVSGFLVLILAYNLARVESPRFLVNLFIWTNVLAIIYCLVQLSLGPGEQLRFFGSEHFWMHRNRGGNDPRLYGPFGAAGFTAAYLMSMTVILVHEILQARGRRRALLIILVIMNLAMMIATGNRGSFLVLLASMAGFLYLFRAQLGALRIAQALVASTVILAGAAFVMINYTDFNRMLERLEATEFSEGGMPDTRRIVWPMAWEAIEQRPLLGHGPKIQMPLSAERQGAHPNQLVIEHPHNLYLYLLVTVGVTGMLAFLAFFIAVVFRLYRGLRAGRHASEYEQGLIRVGLIVVAGFLVDQLKQEFLRSSTVDYAHFIFALLGVFLGWADRARARAGVVPANGPEDSREAAHA